MNEVQIIAICISVGMFGIGLLTIGLGMIYRVFRSPKEVDGDLARAIENVNSTLTRAIEKLDEELVRQRRDHHELAKNTGILSNEVGHLSNNVKALGEEVKNMWRTRGK